MTGIGSFIVAASTHILRGLPVIHDNYIGHLGGTRVKLTEVLLQSYNKFVLGDRLLLQSLLRNFSCILSQDGNFPFNTEIKELFSATSIRGYNHNMYEQFKKEKDVIPILVEKIISSPLQTKNNKGQTSTLDSITLILCSLLISTLIKGVDGNGSESNPVISRNLIEVTLVKLLISFYIRGLPPSFPCTDKLSFEKSKLLMAYLLLSRNVRLMVIV